MFSLARTRTLSALSGGAIFAMTALSGVAFADAPIKDAHFGSYTRWGAEHVNIKLDKIAHVMHVDGRPYMDSQDKEATTGYLIYEFTVQNAGDATSAREPNISAVYDDESEVDGHAYGPYIGTGKTYFNAHLEHLQTVKIRWVQILAPTDHKLTKVILDPGDGGAKLRYSVRDANVELLPDVPVASPTP